jgi:hypothetical protein
MKISPVYLFSSGDEKKMVKEFKFRYDVSSCRAWRRRAIDMEARYECVQ